MTVSYTHLDVYKRQDYDWGHYFSDLFSAQKDLVARAQEEVQCLEEQRQNTIVPEVPSYSPWGKVQECETLCPGVYSVSTPGHGGIMVRRELAEKIFRKEAMGCGFIASGYLCFEEDNDAQVALRELDVYKRQQPSRSAGIAEIVNLRFIGISALPTLSRKFWSW